MYADETLKRLFPGDYSTIDATKPRALIGLHSELIFSSGSGGGLQLIGLSERMLLAGYYRMLLAGPLSMAAYFTSLKTVLDEVRKLADGQSCQVPVIFGLANIELPPDTAVPVPWGTLYGPDRIDQRLVPGLVKVDGLLVTKRPLKILHIAHFSPEAASQELSANFARYQPQMTEWNTETNRTASLMRLAFLLASPDTSFFAVQNASRTVLHPLQQMPLMQWSRQLLAASSSAGLDTAALSRVQEWAEQTQNHPKRLDIAMRRTLAAISDRTDLLDGFIDGVMAWENMFSGRPETNLRVCGAIAWLLEPADYQGRRQLFSELRALYAKRSSLVHGAIETVPDPIGCRDRAVRIAVESMKRLYAHDELLHTKDSADRGGMILLGSELP